ncbi:MAG TPA: sulfotransferase [Spirochaetota bacterium]|nr:sulfotransferase [Spirochaetota bacterium]HPI88981.1 sulfotransferase [Spirochaetota bacterium]HPR47468.1 sulfotransferase [Spirochaetota bacterium]
MVELLKNRLCIQNEFNLNREIAEEKILKPLVIASLPRSGTTLLHNLLSLDGSMRYLKGWESIYPSLHPKYAKKGTDPRIRLHKNEIKLIETFVPQASRVHPMSAEGPEECHLLLAHTFSWSLSFEVLFNIPSHVKWVTVQDMVPVYRYYKKILQLLQWHYSPGPWVLKSPDHLGNLDALLEVFPDANIVFINRDPLDVMPSFCNLIAIGRSVHSDKVDLQEIGREYTERFNRWIESSHNVRSLHHPQHFYDLQYEVFVKDPVRAVRGIYDYFGYDYNPGMDKRIPEWLTGKAWSSNKTHNCTLEDFGLNKKLIKEKFEHFN